MKKFFAGLFAVMALSAVPVRAETIVALTSDKKLRHFDSTAPGSWTKTISLTGIPAGRSVAAIDFRPDGSLVVMVRDADVLHPYEVNPETGAAVPGSLAFGGIPPGSSIGFDAFARGVRIHDLALSTNDPDLLSGFWFAGTKWDMAGSKFLEYRPNPSGGVPPADIVALAASNSYPQAQASVLYGIDALYSTLVTIVWETGLVEKVAPVRTPSNTILTTPPRTGFDISGVTGVAYLAVPSGSATTLHKLDLTTGIAVKVGTIGPTPPEPGVTVLGISAAPPTQLVNLSTRSRVGTGEDVMIAGFIAQGRAPMRLIIRGIGPSLSVGTPLADPVLKVFNQDGLEIASNDNWKATQQTEIRGTGVAPKHDLEAAYVGTFAPGAYTAIVSGKDEGTGVGLVEIYRLEEN